MKKHARLVLLLALGVWLPLRPGLAATAFFRHISDVPLMPGLQEQPADDLVFDEPAGRIAESVATSRQVTIAAMRAFYRASLPQLGWQPAGPDRFVREDERLDLHFNDGPQGRVMRVTVTPTS